ncbi:DNA-binding XRE family transcriptional regulator [Caldalkalibacillus uzonensis]|uniref:DNA-binding XRE family transcriptional regulator n=1 Tax=Caldalkalibacillus uzonensis TaxID=353224 RepID=A0ABU0CS60_9BACI|nr:helix-turn-helix transcriptional regulator [Caldalkalibacillus uzonensis]MDQ0339268.1 DNA-binding XRE family transcriptional regulator [Caldalkalibacillus uzonensis]
MPLREGFTLQPHQRVRFTIEVSLDTAERIWNIVHVTNYHLKHNGKRISPEDVIKIGTLRYIEQFYREQTISKVQCSLGTSFPLKNKIKAYIKQKGISASSLADKAGISKGTLSDILNNKHQPSLDTFLRLYVALDCPPLDDILYRETSA